MGLMDLVNKGVDYINKGVNKVSEVAKDKKDAINDFNLLVTSSKHLEGLLPYEIKNNEPSLGREQMILSSCLTISVEKAKVINNLIPIDETIVNTKMVVESKTLMNYMFVITNKRLWVLNEKEYKTYEFGTVKNFEIINKSLLSQGVKFDDNAFSFEGSEKDIQIFIDTLMNEGVRNQRISEATQYLLGVTPKMQLINMNIAGITLGVNNELVLHNGRASSKLINLSDLEYMQLLIDNAVILTRGKTTQSQVSSVVPARKMSVKFVFKGESFVIDIMPENIINSLVKVEDSTYQASLEFGRKIITTLESMINAQ